MAGRPPNLERARNHAQYMRILFGNACSRCSRARDVKGQRYCRACRKLYMRGYRKRVKRSARETAKESKRIGLNQPGVTT